MTTKMVLLYLSLIGWVAVAASFVLLTPHLLYATLGLLSMVLGMAALYFLQGAALVAVAQILIYGGGLLVLLLFSVMLLVLPPHAPRPRLRSVGRLLAAVLCSGLLWPWVQCAMHLTVPTPTPLPGTDDAVVRVGTQLLGPYVLVFEWVGLNLLLVLVGAVYLVSRRPT